MVAQSQIFDQQGQALMAASVRKSQLEMSSLIDGLPKRLDSRSDILRTVSRNRRPVGIVKIIYKLTKEHLLDNFTQTVEDFMTLIDRSDIRGIIDDYEEVIERGKEINEKSEQILRFGRNLKRDLADTSLYFKGEKHHNLSKYIIKELDKESSQNKKILEEISQSEKFEDIMGANEEILAMSIFLSLEPLYLFSVILADLKGDVEFINSYSELLDRYCYLLSSDRPELYKEAVNFNRASFKKNAFSKFYENRQKIRSVRI